MRTPSVLRTQAFRIVAIYLAIFLVSATALAAFVWWNTALVLDGDSDDTIRAEATGLREQFQTLGLAGLTNVINSRSVQGEQGLYLLTDANHRWIAGNLDAWPQVKRINREFVEFDFKRPVGGMPELHRARGELLQVQPQGFFLLVARDIHDRREVEDLFTTMLPWSALLMMVLGFAGGVLISRNFLRRLDVINRTSRQIVAGDLSQRVPVTRAGDEFDDLSGNLNRMLDRIERLMRGIREVSDNVAHDLRSPLNRLRSRLEFAARRVTGDTEVRREIDAAVEETDRLIGTFNSLLLIAEAEAGSVRESMSEFDLKEVVEGVGDLYEPVAEEKGVRFVCCANGLRARIHGNRNLITQALANLVDNAIKYTPPGGEVRVTLEESDVGATLAVADSGPGIPAADRARVIDRFVRLESSRNSPGTGLGLSLVAAVARLHDAELLLDDNDPGLLVTLKFTHAETELRPGRPIATRVELAH